MKHPVLDMVYHREILSSCTCVLIYLIIDLTFAKFDSPSISLKKRVWILYSCKACLLSCLRPFPHVCSIALRQTCFCCEVSPFWRYRGLKFFYIA